VGAMIKDDLEYKVTQEWVEKFQKTIAMMDCDEDAKKTNFLKWESGRSAIQCHLDKLQEEIAEYERLISCDRSQPIDIIVEDLTKLPDALIKARIAAKMSEKELAEIVGMDEDRIKECEKKNYQCASFVEILEISCALGLEFKTAVMEVNFEEIEASKRIAKEWRDRKKKKASQIS
jgi:hypothetical protein